MSQFIKNTNIIENEPIFSLKSKEVVMPRISRYVKGRPQNQKINYRKQSQLLNTICSKLQKQQFQSIHNENAREMERKFQKLKQKMHTNMEKQSIQKIFTSGIKQEKLNIKQIVNMRPQKIELDKKYGNHILLRMQNFREAEQISKMKEKYRNWYDSEKNDRSNSPIFKKMAYLLQRVSKQNIVPTIGQDKISRKARHTTKQGQQNCKNSLDGSITRKVSPYKKRDLYWSSRRQKFSIFNHNFDM